MPDDTIQDPRAPRRTALWLWYMFSWLLLAPRSVTAQKRQLNIDIGIVARMQQAIDSHAAAGTTPIYPQLIKNSISSLLGDVAKHGFLSRTEWRFLDYVIFNIRDSFHWSSYELFRDTLDKLASILQHEATLLDAESAGVTAHVERSEIVPAASPFEYVSGESEAATANEGDNERAPSPRLASIHEAALLAKLTEKFYGSWPFRIAAGMLVLAAAFALGGTFIVADQSFDIRDDLDRTASNTRDQIDKERQSLLSGLADVNKQREDLVAKFAVVDEKRAELITNILEGKTEIERSLGEFRNYAVDLKDKAVAEVTQSIKTDLEDKASSIQSSIALDRNHFAAQLEQLENNEVKKLRQEIQEIANKISPMSQEVVAAQMQINNLRPVLENMKKYEEEAHKIRSELQVSEERGAGYFKRLEEHDTVANQAVSRTQEQVDRASNEARNAADHAARAQSSADEAERRLSSTNDAVNRLQDELTTQRENLGRFKHGLEDAQARFASLDDDLERAGTDVVELQQGVVTTDQDLDGVAAAVAALHVRRAEVAADLETLSREVHVALVTIEEKAGITAAIPWPSKTEDVLSPSEWKDIQSSLAARGFDPGPLDGRVGGRTRKAIRGFQKELGVPTDGHLSPEQIDLLLRGSHAGRPEQPNPLTRAAALTLSSRSQNSASPPGP